MTIVQGNDLSGVILDDESTGFPLFVSLFSLGHSNGDSFPYGG